MQLQLIGENLLIFERDRIDGSKFPRGITIFAESTDIWNSEIKFYTMLK